MKTKNKILFALTALMMLCGCSTTSRIGEGEQLYNGIKRVTVTGEPGEKVPAGLKSEITDAVAVKPNNPYPYTNIRSFFPLGLWVYNNWSNPDKGLKHWLYEKLVSEPVLISDVRPDLRTKMIDQMLENNGYFRGSVDYELVPKRNKRIASVAYNVTTGPAYRLDSIQLLPDTCHLTHMIDSVAARIPYLKRGERYSTDSLSAVRTRISTVLRNRGYYYFKPDFIEYLADTVAVPGSIVLRMVLASNVPHFALQRYRVGSVTTTLHRNQGGGTPDSIPTSRGLLVQMLPSHFRRAIIPESVALVKGRPVTTRAINQTQTRLSRLGIFNSIDIQAMPDTTDMDAHLLNFNIDCTFDTPLEASIEANVSSKSNSYIGPGVTLGVTNRNIFGGGEQLNVTLTGAYEWQTGRNRRSVFNSYEVGVQGSLAFPRMLAPRFVPRNRRELNWTRITLNAELLNRPHYFKMAQFNSSFNYDWQSSRYATNTLTLLKLTYTNLLHTTHEFDSIMAANEAIAQSFRSQFIPQLAYNFTFDRTYGGVNNLTWNLAVQEAGGLFNAVWRMCGAKGERRLFGIPISQFIKTSTQLVYGRRLGRGDYWLVTRAAVGAAHAYGNSAQVPYSEQFWVGGANSIRAFTVRSIGPGSYHAPKGTTGAYFDQTGTFKFEANVEFRFPILGPLHGALFIDSGNVWLLKEDPARPGGKIHASTFLRDLALGTGAGLRVDIGMLVIRGDLGIGIHAPWDTGRSGYYNMTSFGNSLAFHLAIGYPF